MTMPSTEPSAPAEQAGDEITGETITTTVDIAAPPERVFDALTDPGQLARWWGTPGTYRTDAWKVEPRPGGPLEATTRDPSGREGAARGVYRIVDRPRTLEHTWHPDDEPAPSVVRFDLEPATVRGVSGTRVTVTHTRRPDVRGSATPIAMYAGSAAGSLTWASRLVRLARIVRVAHARVDRAALPPSLARSSRSTPRTVVLRRRSGAEV